MLVNFNDKKYHGLLIGHGWNKGMGMSPEEKREHRRMACIKSGKKRAGKVRLWHLQHPGRVAEIKMKYAHSQRGRLKTRENAQRRLARERGLKKDVNWDYWRWICARLGYRCQMCGKVFSLSRLTVDHQLPINRGGDNDEWNLQPLCKSCNSRKQDRLIGVDNINLDLAYGDWLWQRS